MPQDCLLRMIEQVAQLLAEILRLRKIGRISDPADTAKEGWGQAVGLPFDVVKHSAPETILQLLESDGGTQHVRAVMLAGIAFARRGVERFDRQRARGYHQSCASARLARTQHQQSLARRTKG